jgi:hypothetical protein
MPRVYDPASSAFVRKGLDSGNCGAYPSPFGAPHHQNTAPKSQPPNPGREISKPRIEETAGKKVFAAEKITRDAENVPESRGKSHGD